MYSDDGKLTATQTRRIQLSGSLAQIRSRKARLLRKAAAIMGLPATAPTELIEARMAQALGDGAAR